MAFYLDVTWVEMDFNFNFFHLSTFRKSGAKSVATVFCSLFLKVTWSKMLVDLAQPFSKVDYSLTYRLRFLLRLVELRLDVERLELERLVDGLFLTIIYFLLCLGLGVSNCNTICGVSFPKSLISLSSRDIWGSWGFNNATRSSLVN